MGLCFFSHAQTSFYLEDERICEKIWQEQYVTILYDCINQFTIDDFRMWNLLLKKSIYN